MPFINFIYDFMSKLIACGIVIKIIKKVEK